MVVVLLLVVVVVVEVVVAPAGSACVSLGQRPGQEGLGRGWGK